LKSNEIQILLPPKNPPQPVGCPRILSESLAERYPPKAFHNAGNAPTSALEGAFLRRFTDELNALGIKTAFGGLWDAATVSNLVGRAAGKSGLENAA
jgi:hypothetical protein